MPTPTRKAARATTKSSDRQARCDLGKARRACVASGEWTGVGDSPRLFCGAFDAPGGCRRRVGRGRRRRGLPAPSCYKCKPPARASAEPPPLHPRRRGEASPRGIGGRAHRARARGAWQASPRAHAAAHGVAAACPNVLRLLLRKPRVGTTHWARRRTTVRCSPRRRTGFVSAGSCLVAKPRSRPDG